MNEAEAKKILDKIVGAVFGYQNPLSLEQAREKFAFDRRLPQQVSDSTTGEVTWSSAKNAQKYVTLENMHNRNDIDESKIPTRALGTVEDIIAAWAETNYAATERIVDSLNVAKSDHIMGSENVYQSYDVHRSKNILFTEGGSEMEYVVAGFSSTTSSFCIRVEESQLTTNSFSVNWSAKISNSFFMQDCYDCMDCMFCSHIAGKRYHIANMQVDEAEYKRLKLEVTKWILSS
jgi:hypothetical protein